MPCLSSSTSFGRLSSAPPAVFTRFRTAHVLSRNCRASSLNVLLGAADTIYDPFLGRGTTMIEAALLGRSVVGCDINPLSLILTAPRLRPPSVRQVRERLATVNWNYDGDFNEELLTFYHPDTLREIYGLRSHLLRRNRKHG